MNQLTANIILEQYAALKTEYPNALLVIQHRGYYEAFGDDARTLAETCNLRLNHRNHIDVPNAGFPCKDAQRFIAKILDAGIVLAVADVINKDEPQPAKSEIKHIIQRRELQPEPDGDILWA